MKKLLNHEIVSANTDRWIVFIHGAGGSIKTWKYQRDAFTGVANLLFLDLRDHGQSKDIPPECKLYTFDLVAQDVLTLLDHLGLERVFFLSLSMGSMIVQKLALMRPQLVQGAIVAGGIYKVSNRMMLFVTIARYASYLLPFRMMYQLFSLIIMPRKNHQFSRKVFVEQSKKLSSSEFHKWMSLYREFRKVLIEFYNVQFEFPLLAIMGSQDYAFLEAAKKYTDQHDNAALQIVPKCGHICNIEQSENFNEIAISYYKSQTQR